jgi:hypothetical protein
LSGFTPVNDAQNPQIGVTPKHPLSTAALSCRSSK